MERLRDIVLFVSGAMAIVSVILALYEGFNQLVGWVERSETHRDNCDTRWVSQAQPYALRSFLDN